MADSAADRNLLFGLLALQIGLIDQAQLVAAFQAWTLEKDRPLAEHLAARGDLDAEDRAAVEALVARHLKKHGGSAARSLAALPAARSTQRSLAGLDDPELAASLAGLPGGEADARRSARSRSRPTAAASWPGSPPRSGRSRASSCPTPTPPSKVQPSTAATGRASPAPRPAAIACSARSPAAAWAPSTADATTTSAATWR